MGLFGKKKKDEAKDDKGDESDKAGDSKATTPKEGTTPRKDDGDDAAAALEKELEGLSPAEKKKKLKEKRKAMDWDDDW